MKLLTCSWLFVLLATATSSNVISIGLKKSLLKADGKLLTNKGKQTLEIHDNSLIAAFSIGTPLQTLNVAFDFDSGTFWVPNQNCPCDSECSFGPKMMCYESCHAHCCVGEQPKSVPGQGQCTNKNLYYAERSRSFEHRFDDTPETFRGELINLTVGYETVRFGPGYKRGFTVRYLSVGHTDKFPESYSKIKYDGVFGLSRKSPKGIKTPIEQLAYRGIISKPVATLVFASSPNDTYDGHATIGTTDKTFCEKAEWYLLHPTISAENWDIRVKSLNVTKVDYAKGKKFTATIRPTDPYLSLPPEVFDVLKRNMSIREEGYVMNCKKARSDLASLSITFNRHSRYDVLLDNVLVDIGFGDCLVKLRSSGAKDKLILGAPFFKNLCLVLDYSGYVGLVRSKFYGS